MPLYKSQEDTSLAWRLLLFRQDHKPMWKSFLKQRGQYSRQMWLRLHCYKVPFSFDH